MGKMKRAIRLLNEIAAAELDGRESSHRRPPDPNRNKLQKVKRLRDRLGISNRAALDLYNQRHGG